MIFFNKIQKLFEKWKNLGILLSIFLEKLPVVDRIVSVEEHDGVVPSSNKALFEN